MKITYVSSSGSGPTYEIEADRHGNYTITVAGKVVKRVSSIPHYLGKPRWGSKKLELDALEDAKGAIEALKSSES
jgi:hypothetical protein